MYTQKVQNGGQKVLVVNILYDSGKKGQNVFFHKLMPAENNLCSLKHEKNQKCCQILQLISSLSPYYYELRAYFNCPN